MNKTAAMDNQQNPYMILHRNTRSENWNAEAIMRAIKEDSYFAKNEEIRRKAWDVIGGRLAFSVGEEPDSVKLTLDYIGNRELLYAYERVSLICHRADEPFFAQQAETVLDAARHGCVVVSAFISKKEREIKGMLIKESLPIIEVMDNGFAPQYHPYGDAYDACMAGKMVQISPWTFCPQSECKLTREICLVMNELVRVISKAPDNWWKRE